MTPRHFISYPKSGRTWLRYVLHGLGMDTNIRFHHDGFEFNDGSRPAHDFTLGQRQRDYLGMARSVYLRRDPRDVMVSLYHQVTERFDDFFGYRGTIADFLRDPYFGAPVLARFRAMWQELAVHPAVLTVNYEDCHRDLPVVMQQILDHYELVAAPGKLQAICAAASLSRMKAVEASGTFPHPWLNLRNGAPKVRRGRIGNYADELSAADIDWLNEIFGLPDGTSQP